MLCISNSQVTWLLQLLSYALHPVTEYPDHSLSLIYINSGNENGEKNVMAECWVHKAKLFYLNILLLTNTNHQPKEKCWNLTGDTLPTLNILILLKASFCVHRGQGGTF